MRGPAEILATLDERGALDGLPFMPEMVDLCGKRFTVDRRAEKICDTVNWTGSRRLPDAVLLDAPRCDGSGHGGCQAECRLFWKEAWLTLVDADTPAAAPATASELADLRERTTASTRYRTEVNGKAVERFRCQATQLPTSTEHLRLTDPRPYVREVTTGNVGVGHFVRVMGRAAVKEPMRKLGLTPAVDVPGTRTTPHEDQPLDLQPGELVRVKPRDEIAATLSPQGRNRGLWFDTEMLPYCGSTFRVRQRIKRFIDERDGRMIELKTDAVTLDGVVCSGERSLRRWFCPRAIMPYWRECWLERVEQTPERADSASR